MVINSIATSNCYIVILTNKHTFIQTLDLECSNNSKSICAIVTDGVTTTLLDVIVALSNVFYELTLEEQLHSTIYINTAAYKSIIPFSEMTVNHQALFIADDFNFGTKQLTKSVILLGLDSGTRRYTLYTIDMRTGDITETPRGSDIPSANVRYEILINR